MHQENSLVIRVRGVIIHEGKLLVVRHSHASATNFYALPGGKLEWNEGIRECMVREIEEELGVTPVLGRLLYVHNLLINEVQSIEFFFEITNGSDYLDTSNLKGTHSFELAEILFISPTDDVNLLPKAFHDEFKSGEALHDEVRYIGNI